MEEYAVLNELHTTAPSTRYSEEAHYAETIFKTARLLLNYKDLPYKTEWVEYPDVAPKFKGLYASLFHSTTIHTQLNTHPTTLLPNHK